MSPTRTGSGRGGRGQDGGRGAGQQQAVQCVQLQNQKHHYIIFSIKFVLFHFGDTIEPFLSCHLVYGLKDFRARFDVFFLFCFFPEKRFPKRRPYGEQAGGPRRYGAVLDTVDAVEVDAQVLAVVRVDQVGAQVSVQAVLAVRAAVVAAAAAAAATAAQVAVPSGQSRTTGHDARVAVVLAHCRSAVNLVQPPISIRRSRSRRRFSQGGRGVGRH